MEENEYLEGVLFQGSTHFIIRPSGSVFKLSVTKSKDGKLIEELYGNGTYSSIKTAKSLIRKRFGSIKWKRKKS